MIKSNLDSADGVPRQYVLSRKNEKMMTRMWKSPDGFTVSFLKHTSYLDIKYQNGRQEENQVREL